MSKIHQGGWVASFVVIGAVLILGLLGGVYYLRQHNAPEGEVATNDTNSNTSTEDTRDTDTSLPAEENPGTLAPSDDTSSATDTKENDNDSEVSAPSDTTDTSSEEVTSADKLPETGPRETIGSVVALTALSFSGASYLRSRNHRATLRK